jgi:hypothetical protein
MKHKLTSSASEPAIIPAQWRDLLAEVQALKRRDPLGSMQRRLAELADLAVKMGSMFAAADASRDVPLTALQLAKLAGRIDGITMALETLAKELADVLTRQMPKSVAAIDLAPEEAGG